MLEIMLTKEFADRLIVAFDGRVLSYYSAMDLRTSAKSSGRIALIFRLAKDSVLTASADVFNIFNWQNLGSFDETYIRSDGTVNPKFGTASATVSDPRRFQLGFQWDF